MKIPEGGKTALLLLAIYAALVACVALIRPGLIS